MNPFKAVHSVFNLNNRRSALLFVPTEGQKYGGFEGSAHSTTIIQKIVTHIQLGKYQAQSPTPAINDDCIHSYSSSLPSYTACYGS